MLGSFDPDSLDLYNQLIEAEMPMEYSEEVQTYDFTRCVRADGTAYGTRGRCRQGSEEAKAPEMKKPKASRGAKALANARNRAEDTARQMRDAEKALQTARASGDYASVGKLQKKIGVLRQRLERQDTEVSNRGKKEGAKAGTSSNKPTTPAEAPKPKPQASRSAKALAKASNRAEDTARQMRDAEKALQEARAAGNYAKIGALQKKIGILRQRSYRQDAEVSNRYRKESDKREEAAKSQAPKGLFGKLKDKIKNSPQGQRLLKEMEESRQRRENAAKLREGQKNLKNLSDRASGKFQ